MKEFKFTCAREMIGDREYATGDTRELAALDAAHLVRSGALVPADAEARAAMKEVFVNMPEANYGIVHAPPKTKDAGEAPLNKDAGDAPANKAATARAAREAKAADAKAAKDAADAAKARAADDAKAADEAKAADDGKAADDAKAGATGAAVNAAAANGGRRR